MPGILYCRQCATSYPAVGKIPPNCPTCHRLANWTTANEPRVPYELNANDRRMLRMLRIVAEHPELHRE